MSLLKIFDLPPGEPDKAGSSLAITDPDLAEAIDMANASRAHTRAADEFKSEFVTVPGLAEALGEAFRRAVPKAGLREAYSNHLDAFRAFIRAEHGNVDALTASGPLLAQWVLELAAVRRRPYAEVEQAVAAIRHYHALNRGEAYVEAALIFARTMGGDDGGGKKLEDGDDGKKLEGGGTPAETEVQLPLAAEVPSAAPSAPAPQQPTKGH